MLHAGADIGCIGCVKVIQLLNLACVAGGMEVDEARFLESGAHLGIFSNLLLCRRIQLW